MVMRHGLEYPSKPVPRSAIVACALAMKHERRNREEGNAKGMAYWRGEIRRERRVMVALTVPDMIAIGGIPNGDWF